MAQSVDPSILRKALSTFKQSLIDLDNHSGNLAYQDSCIHRFEYCYELAFRTLRRYLEETGASTLRDLSFASLIRLGFESGLLSESWDVWAGFHDARNITSHTYNEDKALEVLKKIPPFYDRAMFLVEQIEKRQAAGQ